MARTSTDDCSGTSQRYHCTRRLAQSPFHGIGEIRVADGRLYQQQQTLRLIIGLLTKLHGFLCGIWPKRSWPGNAG